MIICECKLDRKVPKQVSKLSIFQAHSHPHVLFGLNSKQFQQIVTPNVSN